MSLIVPQARAHAANGLVATASAAHGPSLKWMWAAIGALGVSVVALGAALVWQARTPDGGAAAPVAAAAVAATQRTPESEIMTEGRAGGSASRPPATGRPAAGPVGYAGDRKSVV